jgi:hypothetical protein
MERTIIAVKYNTLRNEKRTQAYWCIEEIKPDFESVVARYKGLRLPHVAKIYATWQHKSIPKRVKDVLETAKVNYQNGALKRGTFILTLKNIDRDGKFSFADIIEIKKAK